MLTINEEENLLFINDKEDNTFYNRHPRLRKIKKCLNNKFYNECDSNIVDNCIIVFIGILVLVSIIVIITKCFYY